VAWWRAAVAAVVVLLFLGVFQTSAGRPLLKAVGLVGSPNTFTAISFVNPQSLPEQLSTARSKVNLAFTISNHTSGEEDYQWQLTVTVNNKSAPAGKGTVALGPNGTTMIAKDIDVVCKTGEAEITVSLAGLNESIDAWMACR
jgi:hypothetical protein